MSPSPTIIAAAIIALVTSQACADEFPESPVSDRIRASLQLGKAAETSLAMQADLAKEPGNDLLRFATGLMQAIAAIEEVGQAAWIVGATEQIPLGPLVIQLPPNDRPSKPSYEFARDTAEQLLNALLAAEATLAPLEGREVQLPVDFAGAHFDFNGNLTADPEEAILRTFLNATAQSSQTVTPAPDTDLRVVFDTGDVSWLRGYCHAIAGTLEIVLAYDERPAYEVIERRLFDNRTDATNRWDERSIAEVILAIHRARFPLIEPSRPPRAHAHFKETLRLGNTSWDAYLAETDDHFEWIPNPRQTSVTGARVNEEIVTAWKEVLKGTEAILDGRELIPITWANSTDLKINVRKVFHEPRDFDLVEFVLGPGAAPFADEGPIVSTSRWTSLSAPFGDNFLGYLFWFN